MSKPTRSDEKGFPKKPGTPGVGPPFAGESSSGNIEIPHEKRPDYDPNATILDTGPRNEPPAKSVDPDATILDLGSAVRDANATMAPGTSARRTPSGRTPARPNSETQGNAAEFQIGDLLG